MRHTHPPSLNLSDPISKLWPQLTPTSLQHPSFSPSLPFSIDSNSAPLLRFGPLFICLVSVQPWSSRLDSHSCSLSAPWHYQPVPTAAPCIAVRQPSLGTFVSWNFSLMPSTSNWLQTISSVLKVSRPGLILACARLYARLTWIVAQTPDLSCPDVFACCQVTIIVRLPFHFEVSNWPDQTPVVDLFCQKPAS